jgi:preprotein translocase subunit SecD
MRPITLIIIIFLISVVINMPRELKIGSKTFYRPIINLNWAGRHTYRDLDVKLGLDLQGGAHVVYQADTKNIPESERSQAVDATRINIERRINLLGVSEPIIQTAKVGDEYRLIVELAGVSDVNQAINTIGQTAQLEFYETKSATPSSEADFSPTGLTGKELKISQVQFNSGSGQNVGQPVVSLEFNAEGTKKFSEITARNIGKPVAILLDNRIVTAPTVQNAITDGRAIISGNFTVADAKNLVIQLNAGALPIPIKIVEQRNVGASLGNESITKSLVAGVIGLTMVGIFMILNYGIRGLLADVALIIYVLVSLAIIRLVPVTLTLAGIAGLILSIGMAVDANILIFERIKEELRWGRPMKSALELGFHRAWNSIRDSNVSSLITAGILFWFGSGSVRGFALTLIIGVLVSLFSSITVTRTLLNVVYKK